VSWNTTDSASIFKQKDGCDPSTVTADGTFTLSCAATSFGGTTTQSATFKHDGSPPSAPEISGIAAKAYKGSTLPAPSKIACTSSDPTSGLDRCTVDGDSAESGKHSLTATAANGAGATSTATLDYSIAATIRALKVKKAGIGSLLASGIPLSVKATENRTRISVRATASLPGSSKTLTIGKLSKTLKRGKTGLLVKLNGRGKQALRKAGRAKLKLSVTGRSGRATTSLNRSLSVR